MSKLKKAVAKLGEINEGEIIGIEVDNKQIIIVKSSGRVYALSRYCSHEDADLATGFLTEDRVVCPLHLSQFDLADGKPLSPPATEPLKSYPVEVVGDDIFLDI